MAAWQIFKVSRKTFFNPRAWLDVEEIKDNNKIIWDSISGLFSPATPDRTETFDEAIKRLGLNEHSIDDAQKNYQAFTWFFLGLGFLVVCLGFYLIFYHRTISGLILAFAAAALFFGQAFRYSFWHFQIKHRKLGCTFAEWWNGKINEEGSTP